MKLIATQGNFCVNKGLTFTCLSLLDAMKSDVEREFWGYAFAPDSRRKYTRAMLPGPVVRGLVRFGADNELLSRILSMRITAAARPGDIVWTWPYARPDMQERLRARGVVTVLERVNTCVRMFRRCVRRAYDALGWPVSDTWTDRGIRMEDALVASSEFVFAPNAFVAESLLEIGVDESRILRTSYGWSPARLADTGRLALPRDGRVRFLFVGSGDVRKGLPLLLRAWRDADLADAELVLAGRVTQEVAEGFGDLLAHPRIRSVGYVENVAEVYRSCDVFVFPTHEEGGPQVTFEAAGCGLALLVSPMGTGGAFRDGEDAIVVDPFDHDAWVGNLRRLASDAAEMARLKSAARARAQSYTWERVAERRVELLAERAGFRR